MNYDVLLCPEKQSFFHLQLARPAEAAEQGEHGENFETAEQHVDRKHEL